MSYALKIQPVMLMKERCKILCMHEGQGIAGKVLQSNHPFFSADVKTCDISDYPLVHHARKFNLNAVVAIKLRSTYTDDDDYILEFFLPINIKGSSEQQLLLNNLSGTMQRICRSLKTLSDAEIVGEGSKVEFQLQKALVVSLDVTFVHASEGYYIVGSVRVSVKLFFIGC